MQLTKAEEQTMQILWFLNEGTVQDILQGFTDTKPARTTIATVLNILENKNFVKHRSEGRSNIYQPLVSKEDYSKNQLSRFIKNYFDGSFSSLVSFFAHENNLTIEQMDAMLKDTRAALAENKETK